MSNHVWRSCWEKCFCEKLLILVLKMHDTTFTRGQMGFVLGGLYYKLFLSFFLLGGDGEIGIDT